MSDFVLTVSLPLFEQLSEYCEPHLFLPWASSSYSSPALGVRKRFLLFWGYINDRLNFDYLIELASWLEASGSPYCLLMVGPVQNGIDSRYAKLISMPKVQHMPPRSLDELPVSETLAAIIPYVLGNPADDVTTIPNKTFSLLSKGLPLLITGMPRFFEAPFVFRLGHNVLSDLDLIAGLEPQLHQFQSAIRAFVEANNASSRYLEFINLVSEDR
jgi:hypothetical protein